MSDAIEKAVAKVVEAGQLAGAVTLVWQDGRVVQQATIGWRDIEAGLPMARDTIFRIASMSKPITSVAALTLLDEGRFTLDEPISRWVPEFAQMRVLRNVDGALDDTVPAERDITFEDLLTHRSGLTYGDFHAGPIAKAHADGLGSDIDNPLSPDEWIAALAALPLIDQPGAGFHYGHSTDLLGLVIARIEGRSLGEVLRRRVFEPLGMVDTGFSVSADKRDRRARMYGFTDDGQLVHRPALPAFLADRPDNMGFESGGQGLWSTLDDYLAFARLFIGNGTVDGRRLLQPETLALMMGNRLTAEQVAEARMLGMPAFTGQGFGLGVATVTEPSRAAATVCAGGVGTVGWPGAYGGWWQADPTNGTIMIFLAQNSMELHQMPQGIGLGVYGAILDFHALASAGTF